MTRLALLRGLALAGFVLVGGCGDRGADPGPAKPAVAPAATGPASTPAAAPAPLNPLLGRAPVKEAIYRALKTGQNQRWQDGDLSGYAVPSVDTLANGCRTVRYTVDQRPDDPAMTINACDASQ